MSAAASPHRQPVPAGTRLRLPVFTGALLLCLGLVIVRDRMAAGELAALQSQLQQQSERSKQLPYKPEALEYYRLKNTYQDNIQIIQALQRNAITPWHALDAFGQALHRAPRVTIAAFEWKRGSLMFSGTSPSPGDLANFRAVLEKTTGLSCAELKPAAGAQVSSTEYGMQCQAPTPAQPQR